MEIPNRAADLKHGQLVFEGKCTSCHGKEGQGMAQPTGKGYLYPPLWGKTAITMELVWPDCLPQHAL
ncbi:c-type cytochrome [Sphingobacterium sp. E70]|uniref:c-type cytochrome n=1 Tax=Sphingobacterium sp. E70 TaxID=2853439 RepID=UPI00211CC548|nr:c-type cytochrome [Sphingobacterium sp. E70]ULT27485.1 c-type cytochrome [Sphingobacterium sp. E70]